MQCSLLVVTYVWRNPHTFSSVYIHTVRERPVVAPSALACPEKL